MFKHILVPVDGSDTAQMAVDKATALAKAFGSQVTVIYVIDPYPFTGVGTDFAYGQAEYLSAATAEANAAIKAPVSLARMCISFRGFEDSSFRSSTSQERCVRPAPIAPDLAANTSHSRKSRWASSHRNAALALVLLAVLSPSGFRRSAFSVTVASALISASSHFPRMELRRN